MRKLPSIGLGEGGLFRGEIALYILLLLAAAGMRFWELDLRAFHYDESLHAFYSWKLFMGEGYQQTPLMHGPFQFIGTAFVYRLFGDSDLTSRLLPALAGSLVVLLPYFLRHQLGRGGGLLAATFLAFSPSMLYFSRFMRNDIYMVFWSLLLAISMWRYMEEGRARYLYLAAAALGLSFSTKEVTYITLAIWGLFLLGITAGEWLDLLRGRLGLSALSRGATFLLVMATLSLPQASAAVGVFQRWLGVTLTNRDPALGLEGAPLGWGLAVAGAVVGVLFAVSIFGGLLWNPRRWLVCAALFYGIYFSLFTTLFTNKSGLGTGIWGVGYWLVQHGKHRMEQPWFYYPSLLSIYEFLPLILALAAVVYYARRLSPFSAFLVYWLVMSLLAYSVAGEKAPWLVLHIALPLILLGAKFGGDLLGGGLGRWGRWRG
ncbi:MAG: flippase activity-associated protein Agl23, partial [Dehalococcoidia bacterium]